MTDSQRAAMEQALEALNLGIMKMNALGCAIECMPLHYANKALREALAEPLAEPVSQIAKALRVHGMSLIKTTDGYDIMRIDVIKAQSKSPQPSPAKVPLLTDEEILVIMRDGNDCNYCNYNDEGEHIDFAREIERIIRKKVGIK